jgi:creatinine amidohydrolase
MTGAAFAQALRLDPVILVPLASHEDHGPYQPMGDFVLADILAERVAQAATAMGTPAFVAPCLPFGVADYFGSSPGGLALSAASFRAVLDDLLAGLLRHGLSKIVILNGHGGNVPVIHEVTLAIRRRTGRIIPSFYLWKIARQLMERRIGAASNRFGHGAEPLMSLNLALRGTLVASTDAGQPHPETMLLDLPVRGFGAVEFKGLTVETPVEFDRVSRQEIAAAQAQASVPLGDEVAAELVAAAGEFVVHYNSVCTTLD